MRRTGRNWTYLGVVLAGLAALVPCPVPAEEGAAEREFFETKIRPLLVEQCQSCHEGDEPESKLRVDSLDGLLEGGLRGPAIVPGKPEESLLIRAVKHGELLKMPPKEKLSASAIADLAKWIETGAYWPDAEPRAARGAGGDAEPEYSEDQATFWAFQRPQRPAIPEGVRPGDARTPLDRFLDAQLARAGLSPAPPAAKRILLRRATFDLLGLPPTPDELAEFDADDTPDAFERTLDRLLASPHHGIKWGRHWLDVARYGDSNGLDENLAFANAFRYRDYVVEAFNRDKPYDQFLREQLAGDLLSAPDDAEALEQIVATGFLSIGPKMLAEDDPVKMQMDIIDEQVDTLGKAFLGMTFGCARCHHHKFDPISMHDYYGLAGIFKSTRTMDTFTVVAKWHERPLAPEDKLQELRQLTDQLAARQNEIQKLIAETNETISAEARRHLGDYLLAAAQAERRERRLALQEPLGNRSDIAQRSDVILLEAEEFIRGNVLRDRTNYGKEIGVVVNRGEMPNFAEYEINLPHAGLYRIELRYAAAESRPCRLIANSRELKSDAAGKTTGGWQPSHQAWHVEGIYDFPAGKVVLRLEQPTFFPHIDRLLIAPSSEGSAPATFDLLSPEFTPHPRFVQQVQNRFFQKKPDDDRGGVFDDWRSAALDYCDLPDDQAAEKLASLKAAAAEFQQRAQTILTGGTETPSDDPLRTALLAADGLLSVPKGEEIGYPAEIAERLQTLRSEQSALEASLPHYPEAMAVSDSAPEDLRIHYRGSHLTLGGVVPRRFPKILGGGGAAPGSQGSGRLELAHWLTQADHPLTARVIVNRVWAWHFGRGIVPSVDNFGLLGELPTHPELLDWLATEFPRQEWSLKRLHRSVMSSAAYRRSGEVDAGQDEQDPDNRFLGRFSRRRLQVEELRDAILAAAGTLDDRMGGSHLTTPNRKYVTSTANVNPDLYRTNRRSIYLPVVRSALYDVFQAFDFADPNVSIGERQSTTVAPQALFLMNSEFAAKQSLAWSEALLSDPARSDEERLNEVYGRLVGRTPRPEEVQRAMQFLADYAADVTSTTSSAEGQRRAWQSLCRAVAAMNESVFVE